MNNNILEVTDDELFFIKNSINSELRNTKYIMAKRLEFLLDFYKKLNGVFHYKDTEENRLWIKDNK